MDVLITLLSSVIQKFSSLRAQLSARVLTRVPVLLPALLSVILMSACGNNQTASVSDFSGSQKAQCDSAMVANRFIVRWKNGTTTVEESESEESFLREIAQPHVNEIEYSEHDVRVQLPTKPVQNALMKAQSLPPAGNWGQQIVGAPAVWAKGVEGAGITVAIVDSGMDVTHAQLNGQLAINKNEVPANSVDDDRNGYVDDVSGYDFSSGTGNLTDGAGHGTHVAGIIAADPTQGPIQGMAPKAKLLPLRFMDEQGSGLVSSAILAIQYAKAHGAKIVSASWGGSKCSKALQAAISDLAVHDILFVAAAGNGDEFGTALNLDITPEYPAAYSLPNQLTVGATTARDIMAGFSNFSPSLVNLMAPGVNILSTYPVGRTCLEDRTAASGTCTMDGTSMATPFVSGAAALIWSSKPSATAAEVRKALLDSVDQGGFPVSSGGRLNVEKALAALNQ